MNIFAHLTIILFYILYQKIDTSKTFFRVIAEKGNTLYNVISEIISILTNPEDMMSENGFLEIVK